MAIRGVSKKPIPFVPEEERTVTENQTIIWIRSKSGHDANVTMARYAAAGRDGRKGYRDLSIRKLDNADLDEFVSIVTKIENYHFSDNYPDMEKKGLFKEIEDDSTLRMVAQDISADLLIEIMEAANNISALKAGEKKGLDSPPTSPSGKGKGEND